MVERPSAVLDYGAFQHPPSSLFRAYLSGDPTAAPFFDDGWKAGALLDRAQRTIRTAKSRATVVDALVRQQRERGATAAAARAAELGAPNAWAVVTGQQPGLFGGPLYVLYKALATVRLASWLQRESGRPVIPVFWVASDDHDFAEVRESTVLDDSGQIRTLRYAPVREPKAQPTSRILLDETIRGLIDELALTLGPTAHRDAIVERLRVAYAPGATLAQAFAGLLASLFPDLVILDPSDPVLKKESVAVLAREILEASPTSRLACEVGERLLRAGFHQQVAVRPGFLNVFVFLEAERRALGLQDAHVEVRGLGRRMPLAEAARVLQQNPEPWSPGVLLRPLVQDDLLPTLAYVGGPAEVAYHAQIGPLYPYLGVPRPALVPRPSVTLVEPAQARALDAERLRLCDLQEEPEALLARWAREDHPDVEEAFAAARRSVEAALETIENKVGKMDPTLRGAVDAARGRTLHQIEGLHEKCIRALKKRDQARAERLRRTRDALLPGGLLQERGLGMIALLARQGEGVIGTLGERIDLWATGHQVIEL